MNEAADAAIRYLQRGWSVIPVEPRGKRPLVRWQDFQARHPLAAEVRDWFRRWPDANVGVVTGAISGLVVVDIDVQHDGFESLTTLEMRGGALPRSVEANSGGGGRHCYFKHPGGMVRNRVALYPGIDLRGDGGCIVVPPSVHPSGGRYAWVSGRSPEEIALAPLPRRLVNMMRSETGQSHAPEHWRHLTREGVGEGERNNTIASLCGHLLQRGIDEQVALELLLAWNRVRCRPPLDDAEVEQVVASIAKLHREQERDG
jgi:hypothetical protein